MAWYAGIDLGASNVRAVVGDEEGGVLGRDCRATPRGSGGVAVTEVVLDALRAACADAGVDPGTVRAAGIAAMGPLDQAEGTVVDPVNLPGVVDRIPLTGPVGNLVDSGRIALHNDAVAGVIGERFYSDRTPDDMVYLTISSGIGAGIAVDGRVLSGWDGNAGEVGHLTLDPDGVMTCGCGRDGHWEAYCSGENIPRYARQLRDGPVATDLPLGELTAADVFAAAGADPLADLVIERVGEWNAVGVANVVHAYAPLVIHVGGAVALHNPDLVLDPIRERLADLVMSNVPEVQLTSLGEDVVVRGALASAVTDGTGDRARV